MPQWKKTQTGRVVYPRRMKPFTMRDVRRILADLIVDGQLTDGERQALSSMLYPRYDIETVRGRVDALDSVKSFLQDTLLGEASLAVPLASWLVGLMEESLRKSFLEWLKKFDGGKR